MSLNEGKKWINRQQLAPVFAGVFLSIFAGLILYIVSQADLTQITISGSIDANYLMGIFTGIVIAVVGFLGITKGRQDTPPAQK